MGHPSEELSASIDTPISDAYIFCSCGFQRMPSKPFGEHLKREREMRGVSLEEISSATRIAPGFLAALEPKGRPDPGVVADPPEEPDRNWARVFVVVVLTLLVVAGGWAAIHFLGPQIAARLHKHSSEPVNSAPEGGAGPGFAATTDAQGFSPATSSQSSSQTAEQNSAAASAADPAAAPPSDPAISSSGAARVGDDASASGAAPTLDLKLSAAKAAEVKVLADGKPLFAGHMDARQVYRFTAADSLEISSSESSAILLELK